MATPSSPSAVTAPAAGRNGAGVAPQGHRPAPGRVGTGGRVWRLGLSLAVLGVLAAGSLVGQDDAFPFGPFRMYATATPATGRVATMSLRGVTTDGRTKRISLRDLGLRRAELEGQLPRFVADPQLLGTLANVYNVDHPRSRPLVELRIERNSTLIRDARVVGRRTEVVTGWRR